VSTISQAGIGVATTLPVKRAIRGKKQFQQYRKEILARSLSFHDFNQLLGGLTALVEIGYLVLIKFGYQLQF
jgi:hypothetical protein